MTTTVAAGLQKLKEDIERGGLGPVVKIDMIDHPDGGDVIRVELDKDSPRLARTLALWLDLIIFHDMTVGKFRKNDRYVRLNIRGEFASGVRVIVIVPFREAGESARTIDRWIETSYIDSLIDSLIAIEKRHELLR